MLTLVLIVSDNDSFSDQIELLGLVNRNRGYYPSYMIITIFVIWHDAIVFDGWCIKQGLLYINTIESTQTQLFNLH